MTIPDLKIQPATERDVPLILRLIKSLAEYERLSDRVVATEADLRTTLFGSRPAAEVVIAYVGGEPVGYALWFHTFSTFLGKRGLYLEDLFVEPAWRSKGIGRALLAHLAGVAAERDCGRIEWSVLTWNESAIRFYESIGATAISEWTVYRLTGDALSKMAQSRLPIA
jgi:GNAT superfamily N-acetyltransferase